MKLFKSFIASALLAVLSITALSVLPSQQAQAASITYDSYFNDVHRGNIDLDSDTFGCMLVTESYVPNKGTHTKRNHITNEVTGTGYTAGGAACTLSLSLDTTNHRFDVTVNAPSWPSSTLTARGLVVYKNRGGASSADELLFYADFLSNITSTSSTFTATSTAPYRIQN